MLLRQFPNGHISCIKCNMDARPAMPLITCVPLIILSSVVGILQQIAFPFQNVSISEHFIYTGLHDMQIH